jgi:hypothetical protein
VKNRSIVVIFKRETVTDLWFIRLNVRVQFQSRVSLRRQRWWCGLMWVIIVLLRLCVSELTYRFANRLLAWLSRKQIVSVLSMFRIHFLSEVIHTHFMIKLLSLWLTDLLRLMLDNRCRLS